MLFLISSTDTLKQFAAFEYVNRVSRPAFRTSNKPTLSLLTTSNNPWEIMINYLHSRLRAVLIDNASLHRRNNLLDREFGWFSFLFYVHYLMNIPIILNTNKWYNKNNNFKILFLLPLIYYFIYVFHKWKTICNIETKK